MTKEVYQGNIATKLSNEGNSAKVKIIHVDMDQFFAAVEQRDNPELKGKPIAVGHMLHTKDEILPLAKQLMNEVEFHSHPIRLLGLGVSNPVSSSPNGDLASRQGTWIELELEFKPW